MKTNKKKKIGVVVCVGNFIPVGIEWAGFNQYLNKSDNAVIKKCKISEIKESIPKPRKNQTVKGAYVFIKCKKIGGKTKIKDVIYVGHSKTDLRL
jgi:hypothetical protein